MLLTETGLFQNNEHIDAHSMAQISSRFPSSAIFRTLPFCFITASLYVNFTFLVLGAAFTIFSVSSVFPTLLVFIFPMMMRIASCDATRVIFIRNQRGPLFSYSDDKTGEFSIGFLSAFSVPASASTADTRVLLLI